MRGSIHAYLVGPTKERLVGCYGDQERDKPSYTYGRSSIQFYTRLPSEPLPESSEISAR